jgi:hypothetical protein
MNIVTPPGNLPQKSADYTKQFLEMRQAAYWVVGLQILQAIIGITLIVELIRK